MSEIRKPKEGDHHLLPLILFSCHQPWPAPPKCQTSSWSIRSLAATLCWRFHPHDSEVFLVLNYIPCQNNVCLIPSFWLVCILQKPINFKLGFFLLLPSFLIFHTWMNEMDPFNLRNGSYLHKKKKKSLYQLIWWPLIPVLNWTSWMRMMLKRKAAAELWGEEIKLTKGEEISSDLITTCTWYNFCTGSSDLEISLINYLHLPILSEKV